MKKTLSLLALTAALLPLSPLTARGDTTAYWVKGITLSDKSDWSTAVGWYDATKDWTNDGGLCWAATCSNMVTWWQDQQAEVNLPTNVPRDNDAIWNIYRDAFANRGGIIKQGLEWWFDGNQGDKEVGNYLYPRTETSTQGVGGYYKSKLIGGTVSYSDLVTVSAKSYGNAENFSSALVSYIQRGYGVGMSWVFKGVAGGEVGHAVTIWGVEVDNSTNIISRLYMTDSDDYGTTLKAVDVTPNYYSLKGYNTLAMASDTKYNIESFTLLNSTFSNERTQPNFVDTSNNVVLKYELSGGFYLDEDKAEVAQIQFRSDNANLFRHLSIDHDVTADSVSLQAAAKNLLEVEAGSKLTVTNGISGGADKTLTKTGEGTLLLHGDSTNSRLDVLGGDVVSDGTLGEVTMGNGGHLIQQGSCTAKSLTVGDGGTAEVKAVFGNKAFETATVNEGGTLKGSGKFGNTILQKGSTLVVGNSPGLQSYQGALEVHEAKLVYSIDDALSWRNYAKEGESGWGSGTYSIIRMNSNSLTMDNPEFTFALGENILERLALQTYGTRELTDVLGKELSTDLDLVLIAGVNTMADPYKVFEGYTSYGQKTVFQLSDDDATLVAKGLTADITTQNLQYYIDGNDLCMKTVLHVTLAAAPDVPEPTTVTLSLLALAGLMARRRRKLTLPQFHSLIPARCRHALPSRFSDGTIISPRCKPWGKPG